MQYDFQPKFIYYATDDLFFCYISQNIIRSFLEMEAFMASSLEFGIGLSKESALEDLNFNLAGIGTIKLQS